MVRIDYVLYSGSRNAEHSESDEIVMQFEKITDIGVCCDLLFGGF